MTLKPVECASLAQSRNAGRIVLWFSWGVPEVVAMCDYSLHNVASRPAKVGDKLVTTQFAS
jgi:hypothetical protein